MDAGEVRYRVTADTSEARRDLGDLERSMQNTGNSIRNAGQQAQGGEQNIQEMAAGGKTAANDLQSAFDRVKASVAGLIAALGAAKALDMLGDLTKQCVEAYAEYEQLVGGVETLFADAAGTVQGYAAEAYKNVGISANEYMQTVTSFSASLISSLGGDTAKAAEAANTAMVDMADNANKMGTDIGAIQNAYQGFAKQNYTMLDNLKLGYGGTKQEMERLLEDAEKLSGVHYEIGNFADMAEAIHVVQTEMGITGTTAEEAATTIQGSANAMKAAWQNLLVGFADGEQEISGLIGTFTDSVATLMHNVMPALSETMKALPDGLISIAEEMLPVIPGIIEQLLPLAVNGIGELTRAVIDAAGELGAELIDYTPDLLKQLTDIISDVGESLLEALDGMADSLSENAAEIIGGILQFVTDALVNEIPQLVEGSAEVAQEILTGIYDGLMENLPALLSKIPDIVAALLETFSNLTVSFGEFSLSVLERMSEALGENIPILLDAIPKVVQTALDTFLELAPKMVEFSLQAIKEIHGGLTKNLPILIEKCGEVVGELVRTLIEKAPEFVDVAIEIVETIGDTLVNTDWTAVADAAINGLWNALDKAWKGIGNISSGAGHSEGDKDRFRQFVGVDEVPEAAGRAAEDWQSIQKRNRQETEKFAKASKDAAAAAKKSGEEVKSMKDQLADLDHAYKIHRKTEEDYWAERKRILEEFRDESSEEWWADYDKVNDYYDKQAKAEKAAADKAAKEAADNAQKQAKAKTDAEREAQQQLLAAEKKLKEDTAAALRDMETDANKNGLSDEELLAKQRQYIEDNLDKRSELYKEYDNKLAKQERDAADRREKEKEEQARREAAETEAAIKKGLEDKFRDLEAEKISKGYDDKWLLSEKRKYLEALDHDSDLYKDYNLKLLKESERQAEQEAATLAKANEKIKEEKKQLESSYSMDTSSLFKSTTVTDPGSGAVDTTNSLQIDEFKRQLEAKRKLPEKLAKLLDKGMPETVVRQLLKLDPVVALEYTNELLSNSREFNDIAKAVKADTEISVKLAELMDSEGVSDEMAAVGTSLGKTLGESMMEAFGQVVKDDMADAIDPKMADTLAFGLRAVNSMTGGALAPIIQAVVAPETEGQNKTGGGSIFSIPKEIMVRLTDVNGKYIAQGVNDENLRQATITGS